MSRRTPLHRSKARARAGAPGSSRALWPDTSERPGLRKRRMWRLRRENPPSAVVRIDRSAPLRRERLGAERSGAAPGAMAPSPWHRRHSDEMAAMSRSRDFRARISRRPELPAYERVTTPTTPGTVPPQCRTASSCGTGSCSRFGEAAPPRSCSHWWPGGPGGSPAARHPPPPPRRSP